MKENEFHRDMCVVEKKNGVAIILSVRCFVDFDKLAFKEPWEGSSDEKRGRV